MLPLAKLVDAKVSGDREQPRCEARLVLEVGSVLHDPDEGVLDDILGDRLDAQVPQGKVVQGGLVTPNERGEGCPVSALEPDHQDFVADFGCHAIPLHVVCRARGLEYDTAPR
jgi:hypothetical protein